MRKFLMLVALSLSLSLLANDKISAPTQSFMHDYANGVVQQEERRMFGKTMNVKGVETMDCFISLNGTSTSRLESLGVIITCRYDGMVTALVPINKIDQVAKLEEVEQIAISQIARHQTDQAKNVTHAYQVWNGLNNGLAQNFSGEGVVVGVIDTGIDFNHRAFCDENGNTRIKAVYLPNASSANGGSVPQVSGSNLSGYHYTTPEQIAALTCDYNGESHGTHTSGCAGGSIVNGYAGMAPQCDLVLCGLGENMSQTSIGNSAKYIANYAKSQGKPCVISISLGTNTGPHDGSSSICKIYDQVANQYGAIILLAAGNEADATGYAGKTLASDDDAFVIMHENFNGGANFPTIYGTGVMDIWGRTNDPLKLKVLVVNKSSGAIAYTSDEITSNTALTTAQLGNYFGAGSVSIYFSSSNNRKNIYIQSTVRNAKNSSYRITYMVTSAAGNIIDAWSDGGYTSVIASTGKITGYTLSKGQSDGTMCDDICGSKTISIGAMASRSNSNYPYLKNDVAYFSSYGTDCNGVNHPFVTAPGHYVISSLNGYDSSKSQYSPSYTTSFNGRTHYWGQMSGTSMATPVAAGVVALYMQANPELDVDDVKDAIANTATAYVNPQSPAKQRGHGIINALDGMSYILENASIPRIVAKQNELMLKTYVGDTITTTVQVKGYNLTEDVTIDVEGSDAYSVEPNTITNEEILAGTTLTISFVPAAADTTMAVINLNSAGAEQLSLNVTGIGVAKTPTINTNTEIIDINSYAGGSASKTFRVQGQFINSEITLVSDNEVFTLSPESIPAESFENSSYVVVTMTYSPTEPGEHKGTITIMSEGAENKTINVNGVSTINTVAPHALNANDTTGTSFVANWEPCLFATSYSLRVKALASVDKLLTETFAKCDKESSTNIASYLKNYCDNEGWTGAYVYQAVGGLRLGATSYNGMLQTPALDLSGSEGKVSVKFSARAYDTDVECPLVVSCGVKADTLTMLNAVDGDYIVVLDCPAEAGQKIRFATIVKKKRVVITNVEIYSGDLLGDNPSVEAMVIDNIADTSYLVTGLQPQTAYIYDVKALYGSEFSSWSNMIEVTTLSGGVSLYGDVNGDGFVTSADVTAIYDVLLGINYTFETTADVNGDGFVTSADVTAVYDILLGN